MYSCALLLKQSLLGYTELSEDCQDFFGIHGLLLKLKELNERLIDQLQACSWLSGLLIQWQELVPCFPLIHK